MDDTPDASETPTPPTVTLRLRRPAACPGSDGWHDRRLDALDALRLSEQFQSTITAARAHLGRNGSVAPSLIAALLQALTLATKKTAKPGGWAAEGEVSETYDALTARLWCSVDQLRRSMRLLEHVGALVEVAPALSPTPKHSTGRPPRRALPWLYDHDMLNALISGRRITVEVDQAAAAADLTLDQAAAAFIPPERDGAHATPLVDNSTGATEWGGAHATHPLAPTPPSSVSSDLYTDIEKVPVGDPHRSEESSTQMTTTAEVRADLNRGDPPISTEWLDQAAAGAGVTVDELRAEVLDVWHELDANLTDLAADDTELVEYLLTPADRRRALYISRIKLANRARHVTDDRAVRSWPTISR